MREERNWSQEEMAVRLNMSTNGYAKIERAETKAHIPKLEKIAKLFGMDLIALMSFGEKHICPINDNPNYGCNAIGSSRDLASEIQKLQLIVNHKDEIIEHQKREIAHLQEMFELLRMLKGVSEQHG